MVFPNESNPNEPIASESRTQDSGQSPQPQFRVRKEQSMRKQNPAMPNSIYKLEEKLMSSNSVKQPESLNNFQLPMSSNMEETGASSSQMSRTSKDLIHNINTSNLINASPALKLTKTPLNNSDSKKLKSMHQTNYGAATTE